MVLSPKLKAKKLKIIQNGIPLADIEKLIRKRGDLKKRTIDLCWIRGLSDISIWIFFRIAKRISRLSTSEINVHIISAYGNKSIQ